MIAIDRGDTFELYDKILPLYVELFKTIGKLDDEVVVQVDEPLFVKDISPKELSLIKPTYEKLCAAAQNVKIAIVTYFESATEAVKVFVHTPIWAIGLDFVYGEENFEALDALAKSDKHLIAGVIDGRNIWKSDIEAKKALLERIAQKFPKERIIPSTSCSLLHVPYTLKYEEKLQAEIKEWLSFALEKLQELCVVTKLFFDEHLTQAEEELLLKNKASNLARNSSTLIHDKAVQERSGKT